MKFRFLALLAIGACICPMAASVKYSCDFEDATIRNRWVLNRTANQNVYNQLANKWYLGEPGNSTPDGHYGLYISDDNGLNAHYSNSPCWVAAYDTLTLEYKSSGSYTLTFDYCATGNRASAFDGLHVLWIPVTKENGDSIKVMSLANVSGQVPLMYSEYVLSHVGDAEYIYGTALWQQCVITISGRACNGKPHYLAFVWANENIAAKQPGAKIDNIQIYDSAPCEAPTDLTIQRQGHNVQLDWNGTAAEYEVSVYSGTTDTWIDTRIETGTSASFTNIPAGQTSFSVRALCEGGLYGLKALVSRFIYYPEQMCVDFLDLNGARCYVNNSPVSNTLVFNDFRQVSPLDYGPASASSRHTLHFDPYETEPRTGNVVSVVPDGEFASVRLGNWSGGSEAERIEFDFVGDTINYPVLVFKYLPFIEEPAHEATANPRIQVDVLANGQSLGPDYQLDINGTDIFDNQTLTLEAIGKGWHITGSTEAQTFGNIIWKEWTTAAFDLRNLLLHGQELTLRVTSFDCIHGGHCGYVYFTIGGSDDSSLLPGEETHIEHITEHASPLKILRNGQILILRGEKVYTITGQEVR